MVYENRRDDQAISAEYETVRTKNLSAHVKPPFVLITKGRKPWGSAKAFNSSSFIFGSESEDKVRFNLSTFRFVIRKRSRLVKMTVTAGFGTRQRPWRLIPELTKGKRKTGSRPKAIPDIEGFKFSFWSNERDEPIHVHVYKAGAGAKFWIHPEVRLAWNKGFKIAQLRRILAILETQQYAIQEGWKNHFQG